MPDEILVSKNLEENIDTIKDILKDCDDIVYRDFKAGIEQKLSLAIVYTDGLIDKDLISSFALEPLMIYAREVEPNPKSFKNDLFELITKGNIAVSEIKEVETINEAVEAILIGETALLIDKYDKIVILASRGWPTRSINEPQTETVVRGPRDGFTETLKFNTTLIRRRIRDPKLKLKNFQVGRRSKTDVALMYIEDIANEKILNEVKERIQKVDVDSITDSSILEYFIEDNYLSPFPQIENTERPDSVAASLYEGRIAIVVDNSPFVLVVPATMGSLLQSSEDYYSRWPIASIARLVRYVSALIAVLAPSLYVAITSFNPGLLPTQLAYYVAASRANVPFPAIVEAFLMEITIELLREAGTRISGPIGTTIGIVGGLIIGQAAVNAGIVSPLMIIIVAVTTIASFGLPSYEFASGLRFYRFLIMIFSAIVGLYGVVLGLILMLTQLAKLTSFGVPFTAPYSGLGIKEGELKDVVIRVPIQWMRRRPAFTMPKDKKRMK